MKLADVLKSGLGLLDGVGSSKKLGLVAAFVTTCLVFVGEAPTMTERLAALGAATLAVCAYVLGQSRVEAKGAELASAEETEAGQ